LYNIFIDVSQAEQDASEKDKDLNEALERMRQYEAVSLYSIEKTTKKLNL
jgi:hypothetical protein